MENTELEKVVLESGLELSEGEQIKQSYLPFFIQIAEIKEEAKKINFENPTELDEKIARELRLRTVKIRTGSATIKDERKKIHLLRGNLEQSSWNLIKTGCELEEEIFLQVEKKREIAEKLRKENLKNARLELLNEVCDNAEVYPLSEMEEESFSDLLAALTLAKQQKEEREQAELERIECERIEREKAIEAQRLENERLKAEAEKIEKELEAEREKARKEKEAIELKAKQEAEAAEKKLAEERKKAQEEKDAIAEANRIAQEKVKERHNSLRPYINFIRDFDLVLNLDDALFEEELKSLSLQAMQQAAYDNEQRIKREEQEAKEAEAKRLADLQMKAEEKRKNGSDKEKLKLWIEGCALNINPICDNESAQLVCNDIQSKFQGFLKWANGEIAKI